MTDRWSRLAPLTGALFGVIVIAGVIASGGETPKAGAAPAKVVAYYTAHRSEIETSAILFALAFLALLLFAGALRAHLRRTPGAEGLGSLVLAGGVLMTTGALIGTGVEYGLAHNLGTLRPQTAQTLNFLSNELFLPVLAGALVFGLCAGLAILRGATLPKWLGWVAIVLGIAAIVPPASFPALIGFVLWSIVTGVLLYVRTGTQADTDAPMAQPAM